MRLVKDESNNEDIRPFMFGNDNYIDCCIII